MITISICLNSGAVVGSITIDSVEFGPVIEKYDVELRLKVLSVLRAQLNTN